eukprot:jgi/Bigna1/86279/estExt_fgenesh1_pg.C_90184
MVNPPGQGRDESAALQHERRAGAYEDSDVEEDVPFLQSESRIVIAETVASPNKGYTHAVAVPVRAGSRSEIIKSATLLALFYGVNVCISVYNKWLFNGPLKTPIYVTMTHQIICFICCWSLSPWVRISRVEENSSRLKLFLIPLFFVGNIALNNLSLLYTTLALNQLIRSFCPVAVALFAYLIEDKVPSFSGGTAIFCLVFGVTLSISTSPDLEFLGTVICFGSVFGNAVQTVLVSVLKIVKLDPLSIIYHTSIINSLLLLPLLFILGEHRQLQTHVEEQGAMSVFGLTVAGGAIAFAYNLILLSFIQNTSSVYSSIAGSFKTVLILGVSFLFFHQRLNVLSSVGICIACVAFVWNSWLMFKEKTTDDREMNVDRQATLKVKKLDDEDS